MLTPSATLLHSNQYFEYIRTIDIEMQTQGTYLYTYLLNQPTHAQTYPYSSYTNQNAYLFDRFITIKYEIHHMVFQKSNITL